MEWQLVTVSTQCMVCIINCTLDSAGIVPLVLPSTTLYDISQHTHAYNTLQAYRYMCSHSVDQSLYLVHFLFLSLSLFLHSSPYVCRNVFCVAVSAWIFGKNYFVCFYHNSLYFWKSITVLTFFSPNGQIPLYPPDALQITKVRVIWKIAQTELWENQGKLIGKMDRRFEK